MNFLRALRAGWLVQAFAVSSALAAGVDEVRSWEHEPSEYQPPADLVRGAAFIDRILPMPVGTNGLRADVWGGDNVKPRNVDNGIEDPAWSYWCRSVHREADGKYHLFGARWPENHPKGFDGWGSSRVYHAIADDPVGPFRVVEPDIGPGHNVTCFRARDGSYLIGVIYNGYIGPTVNGPWTRRPIPFDFRGSHCPDDSNNSYASREDGSVLMINQPGRVWISEDGLKPFRRVTDRHGGHPCAPGIFEDPIIWRDEVQYNVIFNDWYGRTAFYLRSKDGVNWVWDQGIAYDVNVAKHPDGSRERWYKFERPSVLQDQYGRATHIYFAVLDTRKDLDKPSDGHTTKNIALPLVVPRRLEILDGPSVAGAKTLRVKIRAEPGFAPRTDVDVASLRFGAPSAVDRGRGLMAASSAAAGEDLVVTFAGTTAGFAAEDFVGKLIGADAKGGLLFGFARLPGVSFNEPILDAARPEIDSGRAAFVVENFGMTSSVPGRTTVVLRKPDGAVAGQAEVALPAIPAYGHVRIELPTDLAALEPGGRLEAEYTLAGGGEPFVHRETFQRIADRASPSVALTLPVPAGAPDVFEVADKKFARDRCIAVRSPSTATWLLDGSFDTLTFCVGAAKGSAGGSTVEVWGDGRRLHGSDLLRPKSIYKEAHVVSIPVKGVRRLSLVSNRFFVNDRADTSAAHVIFGEPKLTRSAVP